MHVTLQQLLGNVLPLWQTRTDISANNNYTLEVHLHFSCVPEAVPNHSVKSLGVWAFQELGSLLVVALTYGMRPGSRCQEAGCSGHGSVDMLPSMFCSTTQGVSKDRIGC